MKPVKMSKRKRNGTLDFKQKLLINNNAYRTPNLDISALHKKSDGKVSRRRDTVWL